MDLVIRRDGSWWYQGTEITRQRMVKLFSTVLRRDGTDWCLVTPVEKLIIQVEDAPFLATQLEHFETGQSMTLVLTTNVGDQVVVCADLPLFVEHDEQGFPLPYVMVRANLHARLTRSVYYQLVDLCSEQSGEIGVWSGGVFHSLGSASE